MASKSLGTLTLDLVARTGGFVQGMDKAERQSAKWRKQVESDAKAIGSAVGAGLAVVAGAALGGAAALATMTVKGMAAVETQAKLARSLDTSYDSITALQLAAGDTGLDGLEGSITRLNRRLGAAEVGGGAAANAVKALNLNLAELSGMDVDERVATIADAIRDSGVSSQRAARFAQDLGFEQKEAALFFLQGGDAIRAYRGEVDALGLSLSDVDAAKVVDAQNAMGIFGDLTQGVSQRLAVEFSPILRKVAEDVGDLSKETGGFKDEISDLVSTTVSAVAFVASSVDAGARVFETLGKTVAVMVLHGNLRIYEFADSIYNGPIEAANELIETLNLVPGIEITPRGLSQTGQHIRDQIAIISGAIIEGQSDIQAGLLEPLAGEKLLDYYQKALAAAEEIAKSTDLDSSGGGGGGGGGDPKALEAIAKEITALERAATTWGMTADEVKLYTLAQQGATDAQQLQAATALRVVESLDAQAEAHKRVREEQGRINSEAMGIAESLLTEEESILASYDRRRQIVLDNTKITGEAQTELLRRLEAERDESLLEVNGTYWEKWLAGAEEALTSFDELAGSVVEQFSGQFGDAFESMIFDAETLEDAVAGMAEGMLRSIVNAIGQMIAQELAYQAVLAFRGTVATTSAAVEVAAIGTTTTAAVAATTTTATAQVAAATTTAAAWTPAAFMASIGSFGGAAAIGIAAVVALGALGGFREGGWTGGGGVDEVAGVVHGQEYVFDAAATARIGVANLEAIRSGRAATTASGGLALSQSGASTGGGGGAGLPPVVNIIEDPSKAGQRRSYVDDQGRQALDVWIADFMGEGRTFQAVSRKIGARAVGK